MDCDVGLTIRDAPTETRALMEHTSENFLGSRCKFKIFGDGDITIDGKWRTQMGCRCKIPESTHLW